MSEKQAPYGKDTLCPLFCGKVVRDEPCQREGCDWWEGKSCSLIWLVADIANPERAGDDPPGGE